MGGSWSNKVGEERREVDGIGGRNIGGGGGGGNAGGGEVAWREQGLRGGGGRVG